MAAQVDGKRAMTVDVSEFGAAFKMRRQAPTLSAAVPVKILLPDGRSVTGRFLPLNRSRMGRALRIGGEMEWVDTDWIAALALQG